MRNLKNNLDRSLNVRETDGLIRLSVILEKTFGKAVYMITVNPMNEDAKDVFGIMVSFEYLKVVNDVPKDKSGLSLPV